MANYKDYLKKPDFVNVSTVKDAAARQEANNRFARKKPRPTDPDTIKPINNISTPTIKKDTPKVNTTPQYYRDKKTGAITGVSIPGLGDFSGDADKIANIVRGYEGRTDVQLEKKVSAQEQSISMAEEQKLAEAEELRKTQQVSDTDLAALESFNPITADPSLSGRADVGDVLRIAGERVGIAAAGALPIAAGLTVAPIPGGRIAAAATVAGAAAVGATTGIFTAIKEKDKQNIAKVDDNLQQTTDNISAILKEAKKPNADKIALRQQYQQALAELDFYERQYKLLSTDPSRYQSDARQKAEMLYRYRTETIPFISLELLNRFNKIESMEAMNMADGVQYG